MYKKNGVITDGAIFLMQLSHLAVATSSPQWFFPIHTDFIQQDYVFFLQLSYRFFIALRIQPFSQNIPYYTPYYPPAHMVNKEYNKISGNNTFVFFNVNENARIFKQFCRNMQIIVYKITGVQL